MRIVDPDNPLLRNAVRDWEQGEYNNNRNVKITPNEIKVRKCFFFVLVLNANYMISKNIIYFNLIFEN